MRLDLLAGGERGELLDALPHESALDQQVSQMRILGKQGTMQVGPEDVSEGNSLRAILTIVPGASKHSA
jgi:hypothetical protein